MNKRNSPFGHAWPVLSVLLPTMRRASLEHSQTR